MPGSNDKLRVLRRIPELRFEEELRGYNKHQVDRVLENLAPLADEVDLLLDRLKEAETRAASAEARLMERPGADIAEVAAPAPSAQADGFDNETISKTLLLAQQAADNKLREANEESARLRDAAAAEASTVVGDANAEAERIRSEILAQRATLMSQAETDVAALVSSAKADLDAKVSAAEAELADAHGGTRAALVEEIAGLRSQRDVLVADVDQFEGHLAARRETIREALAELTRVVEDPERLRTSMPPTPADVAAVDPDALLSSGLNEAVNTSLDTPLGEAPPLDLHAAAEREAGESVPEATGAGDTVAPDTAAPDTAAVQAAVESALNEPITNTDTIEVANAGDDVDLEATQAHETVTVADEDASVVDLTSEGAADDDAAGEAVGVARPAWADAIPDADPPPPDGTTGDPFLDELRRVTNEDEEDPALAAFLGDDEEGDKGGSWFSRRK